MSIHVCIRKAREEQTPAPTHWNPNETTELPMMFWSPVLRFGGRNDRLRQLANASPVERQSDFHPQAAARTI